MKSRIKIKSEKKAEKKMNFSIFSMRQFIFIFCVFAFVITTSFLLFFSDGFGIIFDIMDLNEEVKIKALQNFANVLFISLIVTVVYNIIKWFTIKVPITKLLDATQKITNGDFSVRIDLHRPFGTFNEFDAIIRAFNKMAEELSSIETMKTDFVSTVSHELKTPLSVIQNYATILQDENLSKEDRIEYAKIMTNASANLSGLVSNILRLNRLENQQIFPEKIPYNLSEQLCESMLHYENEWERKNLKIETDFDETIIINADRELLYIVWSNLISNAVKFTDEGDSIFLGIKRDGNTSVVTVADSGCGMSEEVTQRIFEKFYQGDTSRATKGNGLGLALVKKVIDITGGEIEVESEPDEGTTFTVRVPLG